MVWGESWEAVYTPWPVFQSVQRRPSPPQTSSRQNGASEVGQARGVRQGRGTEQGRASELGARCRAVGGAAALQRAVREAAPSG